MLCHGGPQPLEPVGIIQTIMSASEDTGVRPPPSTSSDPFLEEQTVLILVGLIASGKVERQTVHCMKPTLTTDLPYSTRLLSRRLLRIISPGSAAVTKMTWVTDSELRNLPTKRFAKVARPASTGPISMPRTSVRLARTYAYRPLTSSKRQRSYWSTIARAFPGTSISIIVFDTPYHVRKRNARTDKWLTLISLRFFPQVCASRLQRRKFLIIHIYIDFPLRVSNR